MSISNCREQMSTYMVASLASESRTVQIRRVRQTVHRTPEDIHEVDCALDM
jgi:hypothetical protein